MQVLQLEQVKTFSNCKRLNKLPAKMNASIYKLNAIPKEQEHRCRDNAGAFPPSLGWSRGGKHAVPEDSTQGNSHLVEAKRARAILHPESLAESSDRKHTTVQLHSDSTSDAIAAGRILIEALENDIIALLRSCHVYGA